MCDSVRLPRPLISVKHLVEVQCWFFLNEKEKSINDDNKNPLVHWKHAVLIFVSNNFFVAGLLHSLPSLVPLCEQNVQAEVSKRPFTPDLPLLISPLTPTHPIFSRFDLRPCSVDRSKICTLFIFLTAEACISCQQKKLPRHAEVLRLSS